jgi:hypothetical protein
MYWWNYRKLALALREGTVKPWQLSVYWVVFLLGLLLTILFYIHIVPKFPATTLNTVNNIAIPAIATIAWLGTSYWINASGDNRDYLNRLVSISFPIFIRLLVFIIPLSILAYSAFDTADPAADACFDLCDPEDEACAMDCLHKTAFTTGSYIDVAISLLIEFLWIYWTVKAFRIASGKEVAA